MKKTGGNTTPLLLLDDILINWMLSCGTDCKTGSRRSFRADFITDTNRDHLDKILKKIEREYKVFAVEDGEVTERKEMAE